LNDPTIAEHSDTVLSELGECVNKGLVHKLDEPQMTTALWDHQLDALQNWVKEGKRGYVDMATATGKTVLGLATIAYDYGELHPEDSEKINQKAAVEKEDAKVLVVADRGLILEQWKEEFDEHLNIPPERTEGDDTIELDWGEIHFRTTKQLLNNPVEDYDLVILDEAHHYAAGSGWGELLEDFQNDILALSGSIDEGNKIDNEVRNALSKHFGEVYTYTLEEAREDDIIPEFEWNIVYAGFEQRGHISDVTTKCEDGFDKYSGEIDLSNSNVSTSVSGPDLITYTDLRNFSSTTEGKEKKQNDEEFKKFISSLFSRRASIWNQSPDLDTVSRMAAEHIEDKKCLVLVRSMKEVTEVQKRIRGHVDDNMSENIKGISTTDREDQMDTVEKFKDNLNTGVLIGTGKLIGEGMDIPHAEVGINVDDGGGVNNTLLQRMGRVLRNPDDKTGAEFYNVVPVPTEDGSTVPREDGKSLVENAVQYRSLGDRIGRKPGYTEAKEEIRNQVTLLEKSGIEMIERLSEAGVYDYPSDEVAEEMLESLLEKPRNHPMILEEFSAETENEIGGDNRRGSEGQNSKSQQMEKERNRASTESDSPPDQRYTTRDGTPPEIIEPSEILDTSIQNYLLEVSEDGILLRDARESVFRDEKVLSPVDSIQREELPVSVKMDFSEIRQNNEKNSLLIFIDNIEKTSSEFKSSTFFRLTDNGMVLEEEKEKIIGEGKQVVEIDNVPWSNLPLTNLDMEVVRIDKNEEGELIFGVSKIE
jgi:superfamily II DNA or RNA helicase